MEQGVHPVEVIELAELLLQDALKIPTAKRAHGIVRMRDAIEPFTHSDAFRNGETAPSALPGSAVESFDARIVVAADPLLYRSPRDVQRVSDLLGRSSLLGEHDGLQANPLPGIRFPPGQPPQFVPSMTFFHLHPAPPFKGHDVGCTN
jgi:hypothetical protein